MYSVIQSVSILFLQLSGSMFQESQNRSLINNKNIFAVLSGNNAFPRHQIQSPRTLITIHSNIAHATLTAGRVSERLFSPKEKEVIGEGNIFLPRSSIRFVLQQMDCYGLESFPSPVSVGKILPTKLQGVTYQKTVIVIVSVVWTLSLTNY
jgi:hypothetical protein